MTKNSSGSSGDIGNTKQCPPSKMWCFTLNNYTSDEFEDIKLYLSQNSSVVPEYVIGKEVGENGTPHLQGFFCFAKKIRFTGVKKIIPKAHWEKCKGSKEQNIEYCSKEGNFICGGVKIKKPIKTLKESQLFDWQKDVIEIIKSEPDDRKIYWFWEPEGCKGKTTFCKYLALKYGTIPIEGRKNDILYCAAMFESDIYLMDIERSMEDYISYGAIEKIKNGFYMCAKYESKPIIRNCPHLMIFANFPPDKEQLSIDRWIIRRL